MKVGYSFEGLVNRVAAVDESAVHKTGDETVAGLKTFTSCPASSGVQGAAGTHLTRRDFVDEGLAKKLNLSGGTMTGNLAAPTVLVSSAQNASPNALARKDYVDSAIAAGDALQVSKTGDSMSGQLILTPSFVDTSNNAQLAHIGKDATKPLYIRNMREHNFSAWLWEKVYAGSLYYSSGTDGSGTSKIRLQVSGSGEIYLGVNADKRVYHEGFKPTAADVGAVNKSGGTMTGNLAAPTVLVSSAQNASPNALARKDYVDSAIAAGDALQVSKTGDTMTGQLVVQASNTPPIVLKSTTAGVETPQFLIGVDSTGAARWYVGQGNPASADVFLHSYKYNTNIRVGADSISFNKDPVSLAVQGTAAGSLVRRDYLQEEIVGQTPQRAVPIPGSLDLNTFLSPGIWYQDSNANAISGRNYPTLQAGVLTIEKTAGVIQTYKVYNSSLTFTRAYYNGVWTSWVSNFNANYPPNSTQVGAVSLSGDNLKVGQLIVVHEGIPLVMRSPTAGATQPNLLLAQDTNGNTRWYIGQDTAGNGEAKFYNHTLGTNLNLAAGAVIANRPLQDNTGTTFTTGRLPTAAQGNSNVVQGQHSVVGSYIFATLKPTAGSTANPGTNVSGVNLHPCGAGQYTENRAWVLAGTWMCMGAFNASNSDDSWDDRATLWFRVA